jgi:hypothetical protein
MEVPPFADKQVVGLTCNSSGNMSGQIQSKNKNKGQRQKTPR